MPEQPGQYFRGSPGTSVRETLPGGQVVTTYARDGGTITTVETPEGEVTKVIKRELGSEMGVIGKPPPTKTEIITREISEQKSLAGIPVSEKFAEKFEELEQKGEIQRVLEQETQERVERQIRGQEEFAKLSGKFEKRTLTPEEQRELQMSIGVPVIVEKKETPMQTILESQQVTPQKSFFEVVGEPTVKFLEKTAGEARQLKQQQDTTPFGLIKKLYYTDVEKTSELLNIPAREIRDRPLETGATILAGFGAAKLIQAGSRVVPTLTSVTVPLVTGTYFGQAISDISKDPTKVPQVIKEVTLFGVGAGFAKPTIKTKLKEGLILKQQDLPSIRETGVSQKIRVRPIEAFVGERYAYTGIDKPVIVERGKVIPILGKTRYVDPSKIDIPKDYVVDYLMTTEGRVVPPVGRKFKVQEMLGLKKTPATETVQTYYSAREGQTLATIGNIQTLGKVRMFSSVKPLESTIRFAEKSFLRGTFEPIILSGERGLAVPKAKHGRASKAKPERARFQKRISQRQDKIEFKPQLTAYEELGFMETPARKIVIERDIVTGAVRKTFEKKPLVVEEIITQVRKPPKTVVVYDFFTGKKRREVVDTNNVVSKAKPVKKNEKKKKTKPVYVEKVQADGTVVLQELKPLKTKQKTKTITTIKVEKQKTKQKTKQKQKAKQKQKVEVKAVLFPETKTKTAHQQDIFTKMREKTSQDIVTGIKARQKSMLDADVRTKVAQKQKVGVTTSVGVASLLGVDVSQATKQSILQDIKIKQITEQKLRDLITTRKVSRTIETTIPLLPIPPKTKVDLSLSKPKRKKRTSLERIMGAKAYAVLIKRRGKFKRVSGKFTKKVALDIGAQRTARTLAAQFKIEPVSGIPQPKKTTGAFERLKTTLRAFKIVKGRKQALPEGQFIQVRKARLGTRGERREIQRAKRASSFLKNQKKGGKYYEKVR